MDKIIRVYDGIGALRVLAVFEILQDYNVGVFDFNTKFWATLLYRMGDRTKLVQIFANGNLDFPEEVIEAAREFSGI